MRGTKRPTSAVNHAADQRDNRHRIEAIAVLIDAATPIERIGIELRSAHEEVVRNHDARDRSEQSRVADQPAEDVVAKGREPVPRHHQQAKKARDQSAHAKADVARRKVGEVVRRTDDIRADVDVQRRNQQCDRGRGTQAAADEIDPAARPGDQMGSPKTTADADVTAIPRNEYSTIATGKPMRLTDESARPDSSHSA